MARRVEEEMKLNPLKTASGLKGIEIDPKVTEKLIRKKMEEKEARLRSQADSGMLEKSKEPCDTYSTLNEMLHPKEDFGGPKSERLKSGIGQIPPSATRAIGYIFAEGEEKYGRDNWKRGAGNPEYQAERLEHAESHFLEFKDMLIDEQFLGKEFPKTIKRRLLAKVAWFCATQIELMRLETIQANEEVQNAMDQTAEFHEERAAQFRS